jgi:hypothetical protein
MRNIQAQQVTDVVRRLCIEANCHLTDDLKNCITACRACETFPVAQGILDQLTAASSDEMPALFDQLMNEHSQDGRDESGALAAPDGYTTTTGQMVAEFETAALALEPGQISGLVKSTYGYHIILRGEVEDLDSYADAYASSKLDAMINQWLTDAEISFDDALNSMDVADFYSKYIAWQEAYVAQMEPKAETK